MVNDTLQTKIQAAADALRTIQERQAALANERTNLERELREARAAEAAAAEALDAGGSAAAVKKATARVRDLEDALRIIDVRIQAAVQRSKEAHVTLEELRGAETIAKAEGLRERASAELQKFESALNDAAFSLTELFGIETQLGRIYRAEVPLGERTYRAERFADALRGVCRNRLAMVQLGETGGAPNPLGALDLAVSELKTFAGLPQQDAAA